MIYGYARVSTKGQAKDGNSLEAQEIALRAAGATMVVTKLDRMARSATQGIELIQGLLDKGIIVHVLNMGLMDNTPTGKRIRNIMLAFAEFERDMIVEHTSEGKAIAKQNPDFGEGRPNKYSKAQISHALDLLQKYSYMSITLKFCTFFQREKCTKFKRD